MTWKVDISKSARKFMAKNHLEEDEILSYLRKVLAAFREQPSNIDLKKLKGDWDGFYRLRIGKIRIIFSMNFAQKRMFIDRIDFRGDVYN